MDVSAVPITNDMKAGDSLTSPKLKKRRRSSAVNPSPLGDSPDPTSQYGRTRKPKKISGGVNDNPDWKAGNKKRKRKTRKQKEKMEKRAFNLFSEKHLERVMDDHSNMTVEEAQKFLHLLWSGKDEDERTQYFSFAALVLPSSDSESDDGEVLTVHQIRPCYVLLQKCD